jgi:membrane protease YdiL (CAAX protease family)
VLSLWIPYAILNTVFPGPALTYALGGGLAIAALGWLWWAGFKPHQRFLQMRSLSLQGAIVLVALSAFIPVALAIGRGQPWNWLDDLVYAPASAIAQELYFRSALLAALTRLCQNNARRALLLQALLFALWHVRAFEVVSIAPAVGVLVLTFAAGWLWGWQVQRDQTVFYAMAQHIAFLIIQ